MNNILLRPLVLSLISILALPAFSLCQNVGVGTSTPSFKLDVRNGSINTDSVYRITTFPVLSIGGAGNLFVGQQAGPVNTGSYNMFAGSSAGIANTIGSFNSFIGSNAGNSNTTGSLNSFFGVNSGFGNVSGSNNCFFGMNAGANITTGSSNCLIGSNSGINITIGNSNVVLGKDAFHTNIIGGNNVVIGDSALYNSYATSFGPNVAIGSKAGYSNVDGAGEVFIGYQAGYSAINGDGLVMIGYRAGYRNTSGEHNSFMGDQSGHENTTGIQNTSVGYQSGYANATGSNNSFFGSGADFANTSSNLSYAAAIGSGARVACSNCLVLGGLASQGSQTRVGINNTTPSTDLHIIQQTDASGDKVRGIRLQRSVNTNHWRTMIDPSNNYIFEYNDVLYSYVEPVGGAFVNPSDERLKTNIVPLTTVLDKLLLLQPKTYQYIATMDAGRHSYGFLAQDVEKLFPEFVFSSENGTKGIAYHNFSVIAVKAIQEQQEIIKALQIQVEAAKSEIPMQIEKQQKIIETLQKKNDELEKRLEALEKR